MDNNASKANVEDIVPSDDAFHGPPKRVSAEWWYFDAIFNNNYSAHIGFKTFFRKKLGMVSPNIQYYKDGKLVADAANRFLYRNFFTSNEIPIAKLFKKSVFEFNLDRYKENGDWIYDFKYKIKDNAVDLNFKGLTKGWKIETDTESWTVALPKARVSGEIVVNGKKMSVDGIGYHDHNWNYSMLTVMNYGIGWYWGKIRSESFVIVWANIIKSSKRSELIAVINQDYNGYMNINPNNFHFSVEKFSRKKHKKIPTCFKIQIDDIVDNKPVKVDVELESENYHYGKQLLADYWRYHVKSNGKISVGSKTETLDDKTQIIEYLRYG
jgi:predicted secreted hydrolase